MIYMLLIDTIAHMYTTPYHRRIMVKRLYVRISITSYDIKNSKVYTIVDHTKVKPGIQFIGVCNRGYIKALSYCIFHANHSSYCIGEK